MPRAERAPGRRTQPHKHRPGTENSCPASRRRPRGMEVGAFSGDSGSFQCFGARRIGCCSEGSRRGSTRPLSSSPQNTACPSTLCTNISGSTQRCFPLVHPVPPQTLNPIILRSISFDTVLLISRSTPFATADQQQPTVCRQADGATTALNPHSAPPNISIANVSDPQTHSPNLSSKECDSQAFFLCPDPPSFQATHHSISSLLPLIEDRFFVLRQCATRTPHTVEAARALFEYASAVCADSSPLDDGQLADALPTCRSAPTCTDSASSRSILATFFLIRPANNQFRSRMQSRAARCHS